MKPSKFIPIIILKLLDEANAPVLTKVLIDECHPEKWAITEHSIYRHIQKLAELKLLKIIRLRKLSPENLVELTTSGREWYHHFYHFLQVPSQFVSWRSVVIDRYPPNPKHSPE